MLDQFFQFGPIPANSMGGSYDPKLVVLSYIVAVLASYIALDITGRLRDINNTPTSKILWVCGGSLAMGAGIWSMHFIGMLAFSMAMPMSYDLGWTALSMVVAICASAFALTLLSTRTISISHYILGGVILGLAIASMHYTGMQAMSFSMNIHYLPGLFFLSIIIAIIASEAALYLAIKSTQVVAKMRFRLKVVSAFIMGAAICGMHYTGMAAAVFTPLEIHVNTTALNPEIMAISVAGTTLFIIAIAFLVSTYKESINQQLLLTARQAGMAEVAASVLHNVGNVLNSVNVSSMLISEKINRSKLSKLNDLKNLINENKNDLNRFLLEDPRGKHMPEFLINLAEYWDNEKASLENEIQLLMKNVEYIKNIISTQQDISRVEEIEQLIAISDVMDEAILITGVENDKYEIQVQKQYENIKPVYIDKVKLLQILVNLLSNAKDAVSTTTHNDKTIAIKIIADTSNFFIQVSDNGIGIPRDKLTRIFAYGFTTKKNGHGFGLHTSAISAKEMGGDLKVESLGANKGATFIVTLPYKTQ